MNYVDPFVSASRGVLGQILGELPSIGDLQPMANQFLMEQCNLSVSITGPIQGTVIYGFSLVTADRVASKMLGTMIRTFDAIAASAMVELCNMISTSALQSLEEAGMSCGISPVVMVRGTGCQMSMLTVPAVGACVKTTVGELHIIAGLEEHVAFAQRA